MKRSVINAIAIFVCFSNAYTSPVYPLRQNNLNEIDAPKKHLLTKIKHQPYIHNLDSYEFGYDIEDSETNNVQYKKERRHDNGTITGSYGYLQPDGNVQKVNYVADKHGYRAAVQIVPRAALKPIQIFRPETALLDFSSNLPSLKKFNVKNTALKETKHSVPLIQPIQPHKNIHIDYAKEFSNVPFPQNVPNYISKPLEKPSYRMERGFVPYFPEQEKKLNKLQNLLKDYYVIPLQ